MRMSGEEEEWIRSEYRDSPLFAAIDRFAKDVSCMDGMPAWHPSLLFYLAVCAIDDIKCIDFMERRLEKCQEIKSDIIHYLKIHDYENHKKLVAVIIYCVRYGLVALSYSRCIKEISIMSEHINELIPDQKMNAEIRSIARMCFGDDKFKEWFKGYYDGSDFISETITSEVKEMRKANPPKEEIVKQQGRGNRNKELFSDEDLKRKMLDELKNIFIERQLNMKNVRVTKNSEELKCLLDFYINICERTGINYINPRGYIRFLKEAGFSFATNEENVEVQFRKTMRKHLENWKIKKNE